MSKLESLTKDQIKLMEDVRLEWLSNIFDYKLKLDRLKATACIKEMYKDSKLKEPQFVIFVDSPMGMQYAANLIKKGLPLFKKELGGQVRDQVGGQVGDQVGDQVWGQVGGQVWGQVRGQVGGQVGDQVGGQVGDQVGDQVRGQVGGQVGDQVWDQVRGQVGDQKIDYYDFAWRGINDYGWCAFYDFFKRIGIVNHEGFDKYLQLLETGIYDMITLENVCIACSLPTKIQRTEVRGTMRLHCIDGHAIEFGDGYGQNYLWGVYFDPKLFKKVTNKIVSAKTVLSLENIDQRMAALKLIGAEKLLKLSKAKLIDKSARGNELYEILDVFSVTAYYLKYTCPSTGRIYASGIDPVVGKRRNADLGMAWKLGMTVDQYSNLTVES